MGKILYSLPYIIHQNFFALLSGALDTNLKENFNSNKYSRWNKFSGILVEFNINQEYNFDFFYLFTISLL